MPTVSLKSNLRFVALAMIGSFLVRIFLTVLFGWRVMPEVGLMAPVFNIDVWRSLWGSWDAAIYQQIAFHGYTFFGQHANIGFWPLWPILLKAGAFTTTTIFWWGIFLTHLLIGASSVLFYRLVRKDFSPLIAKYGTWLLFAMPVSFMFFALYSEGLFLTLSLAVFFAGSYRRWGWAVFFSALVVLTRHVGLIIVLPLALQMWSARKSGRPPYHLLLIPVLAAALFPLSIGLMTGDPMSAIRYQQIGFRHYLSTPWHELLSYLSLIGRKPSAAVALAAATFGLVLVGFMARESWNRRFPVHYWAYAVCLFFIPLFTTNNSLGLVRYQSVIFPFAILLASGLRNRSVFIISLILLAVCNLFLLYFWAGSALVTL